MNTLKLGELGIGGARHGEMDLGKSLSRQPQVSSVSPISPRLGLMKGCLDLPCPCLLTSPVLIDLSLWRTFWFYTESQPSFLLYLLTFLLEGSTLFSSPVLFTSLIFSPLLFQFLGRSLQP